MTRAGLEFAFLLALCLTVACARPLNPVGGPAGPSSGQEAEKRISGEASSAPGYWLDGSGPWTAGVRLIVVWPLRKAQTIPQETDRIEVGAFLPGGILPVGQQTARRQSSPARTEIKLDALPAGQLTLKATARDAAGKALAQGVMTVTLRPNEILAAKMILLPADIPTITAVFPTTGLPGQAFTVFGTNFGATTKFPLAVFVGEKRAPVLDFERSQDGLINFKLPIGAINGPLIVSVGGLDVIGPVIRVIASLSVSPIATTSFAPSGLVDFVLSATDTAGEVIANPALGTPLIAKTGCPTDCQDPDSFVFLGASPGTLGLFSGTFGVGQQTGLARLLFGSGTVTATATVDIHAFGRADLVTQIGTLDPIAAPADNLGTPARAELGRALFNDTVLSGDGKRSCATCHNPGKGFGDGRRFGLANDGGNLPRNTAALLDAAHYQVFGWDGKDQTLEGRVQAEIVDGRGMAGNSAAITAFLQGSASHSASFSAAYQASGSIDLVGKAIANYLRTRVTPQATSPFDRWVAGDDTAMNASALRGLAAFIGRGRCVACHSGPTFSDGQFHNIAVQGSGVLDLGRMAVSGKQEDRGTFRTPILRNVAQTAPYFHDGSAVTLADAIRHFQGFVPTFPNISPKMKQINLSASELGGIEAFFQALTASPSQ